MDYADEFSEAFLEKDKLVGIKKNIGANGR
jgi:hypothetical protein